MRGDKELTYCVHLWEYEKHVGLLATDLFEAMTYLVHYVYTLAL
jgi:hypothetical protein